MGPIIRTPGRNVNSSSFFDWIRVGGVIGMKKAGVV
jgi:hypothetical protein